MRYQEPQCACTWRRNCIAQLSPSREYALRTVDFPARSFATPLDWAFGTKGTSKAAISPSSIAGFGREKDYSNVAGELAALKVDVIVTAGHPAALAAKSATSLIPIIALAVVDPVGSGLAEKFVPSWW
jgi:hypothetical protein